MENKTSGSRLGLVIALGAVWGLSEAALGMGLRSCAVTVSGSIMTGVALFFLSAGWVLYPRPPGTAILVVIASLFKLFDALLLSLPVFHGAVGNPIFAFFMEGAAFLVIVSLVSGTMRRRRHGQALAGGLAALLAVNLFPLVKYVTGVPACTVAGTGYPLSLYYAYIAVAASMILVPLGHLAGENLGALEARVLRAERKKTMAAVVSPAAIVLCLLAVLLIRTI